MRGYSDNKMVKNLKVDIIIPIYNAYDEVVRCIESIKKWTDLEKNRLILVNDNSPDERIKTFLDQLKLTNTIVIHNENNKGFSANINIGMAQSDQNDVILLNSDTVVTQNWIEKLVKCAYSDKAIATVTPLSNNATLCSVPDFLQENKVPDEYTVDEYAELIERISLRKYPEIPVAHGFCMYVKREVIDKIGNFDAETFGRGYGEETDFCFRAIEVGYHHVMCDDTFILHTGTSSFVSEEKRKYIEAHEKIINDRYPELNRKVQLHCRDNPNAAIFENVRIWIDLNRREKRKTILYLLHSDFKKNASDNIGGTQLHVKDLMLGLRERSDIVVVARDGLDLNVTLYTKEKEYAFKYYVGEAPQYQQFRSEKFAKLYHSILCNFDVDIVHVHHVRGMTLELFYEAEKMQLPIFVTMHDYYFISPNITLLSKEYEHYRSPEEESKFINEINEQIGIAESIPYVKIWREEHAAVLRMVNEIFTPSESAKKIITRFYPQFSQKIVVVEHGIDCTKKIEKKEKSGKKEFHVAFLGGISIEKGYNTATQLIRKSEKDIQWYLFGKFQFTDLMVEKKKNFHNIGEYKREDLPDLMNKYEIDLVCILPIVSETFCYTLSEAVLCGIPVLVTDVGALGERVQRMQCGWIVPYGSDSSTILEKIRNIKSNPEEYKKIERNIRQIQMRTTSEMCNIYGEIYNKNYKDNIERTDDKIDYQWMLEGYLCEKGIGTTLFNGQNNLAERLQDMDRELQGILNSNAYKVATILWKIKIPFRKQIKKILSGILYERN